MKKIIMIILVISSILLSACECNNGDQRVPENFVEYNELGLNFILPEGFSRKEYSYGQVCFSDRDVGGNGYFFFDVYSAEGLENDLYLPGDITVKDFMTQYVNEKDFITTDFSYDIKRDIASVDYVYSYPNGELPDEYYVHIVMRGAEHLYFITMSCDNSSVTEYKSKFIKMRDWLTAA